VTIVFPKKTTVLGQKMVTWLFVFSFVNSRPLQRGGNRQNAPKMDQNRLSWPTFCLVVYRKRIWYKETKLKQWKTFHLRKIKKLRLLN